MHEKEPAGVAHGQPCLSHHLHLLRKLACASLCSATLKPSAAARSWASKTEECVCVCVLEKSKEGYQFVCDSRSSRHRQHGQIEGVTEANKSGKCICA